MSNAPSIPILLSALLATSGCTDTQPTQDRFEQTGQLIALSGGDAGARGACVTCHGLSGEGDGNRVPRLAGLNPGYFARQMEYFAQGQRRHPHMTWIAGHLDWPARQKLAVYYADMTVAASTSEAPEEIDCEVATLYHRGNPSRGLVSCASCHGEDGTGTGDGNPPLAAQPAPYLEAQLKAWAAGERYGDPGDAMQRISARLSEIEMARLAHYSSALPGAGAYPELPEACLRTRRRDPRSGA